MNTSVFLGFPEKSSNYFKKNRPVQSLAHPEGLVPGLECLYLFLNPLNFLFVYCCVYLCVWVWAKYVCVVYAYMHVRVHVPVYIHRDQRTSGVLFCHSLPYVLETVSRWTWSYAGKPPWCPGYTSAKASSGWLCRDLNWNSSPHDCTVKALSPRAILPAPIFYSLNPKVTSTDSVLLSLPGIPFLFAQVHGWERALQEEAGLLSTTSPPRGKLNLKPLENRDGCPSDSENN